MEDFQVYLKEKTNFFETELKLLRVWNMLF